MPDIDIDFDDLRRGEVIEYVKQKYGEDNVTQIITFGTMGAKGVVRDVGRALGLAFAEVDKIAKLVPDGLGMTLERALELSPELKALPRARSASSPGCCAARAVLEGLARHASTHAAGVLITPGPLLDYVPLYRAEGRVGHDPVGHEVGREGRAAQDGLPRAPHALGARRVRSQLVRRASRHRARPVERCRSTTRRRTRCSRTPTRSRSSSSSRAACATTCSSSSRTVFEDLVAMNALYRPGPMENIPYFIDCKHGRRRWRATSIPTSSRSCDGTYGVFVYQEQVMQAANVLAGFSMAQADELRRAMGKKLPAEMEAKRQQFIEGCRHRKIPPAKAEKIFATMEKFAGYGFNKSHSAPPTRCSRTSAPTSRRNYPAEFMAATLTSEM